jgi:large subunit ribosomal protein L25
MKSLTLKAEPRTATRRKGSKALRAAGSIPANIYGKSISPQNLQVDAEAFSDLIHSAHSEIVLVDLEVAGDAKARLALVQDVQHHPLSGEVLHVDFHEVKPDEMITIRIPVEATGEAEGVKTGGGTLEHVLQKVRVTALPKDLPEQIVVDVSSRSVRSRRLRVSPSWATSICASSRSPRRSPRPRRPLPPPPRVPRPSSPR